jgi:hypothetical protein
MKPVCIKPLPEESDTMPDGQNPDSATFAVHAKAVWFFRISYYLLP